jgi:hypothetical protein
MSTEPYEEQGQPQEQDRWSSMLQEVHEEHQTGAPWYQQVGVFFAWAGGIALSADVVAVLALLFASLVSQIQFTVTQMLNWLFFASCALLFAGLFAPSAAELQETAADRQAHSRRRSFTPQRSSSTQRASSGRRASDDDRAPVRSADERRMRAIRRRLRRVYNPWQWRLWASALISVGVMALIGLLVGV